MADAKKLILTSSEITQREQPFSYPWNAESRPKTKKCPASQCSFVVLMKRNKTTLGEIYGH
ncbi:MAG: hypothetical protein WD688_19285 [Candidatus Binatia bacterium]